ncbi:glutamate--tRNA ligase [candidate division WWE3 bacterium CG10_big_fil_rev_8_21_14_0_10_32_10]|uniref:Glutamate--tRNA ligase n=1 Tax=candidate division WWE3 bacterium CG10_big_fil_rev_8_21_14_0_10_32_10 TaxID=1975090 RepID=A0A2H0RCD8_UNCKA|nr:MAG: glutamate--tRNA ligase [candidate division WWE3 bacterium CG10_big_fil_rev_8_21_14_0_10_32_10]
MAKENIVRTRIAPSPTGFPHIGTIYQALIDKAIAQKSKGKFVVRIEDTDRTRFVEEAENKILDALDWIGLTEDEGVRKGGSYSPYRQSERLDIYQKYAHKLINKSYAYPCFCTRERLDEVRKNMQKNGLPPMYDKHCLNIPKIEAKKRIDLGEEYVVRMKVPDKQKIIVHDEIRGDIEFDSSTIDDQVILKSDGYPTYHLAVVVDDHLMKITHVVRGPEWISSFPKHKILYNYFNWTTPVFIHTPLISNMDGSKMSKRQGHANVEWYKNEGFLPEALLNFISLLGWSHPDKDKELFDFKEYVKHFDYKNLSAINPKFDLIKLEWLNGQYIKKLSAEEFYNKCVSYNSLFLDYPTEKFKKVLSLIKERVRKLSEVSDLVEYFFVEPSNIEQIKEMSLNESKMDLENTVCYIRKIIDCLEKVDKWNETNIDASLQDLMNNLQIKPRQFFMPIRIIVSGKSFTPPLGQTLELIGKNESINRLLQYTALN